MGIFKKPKLSPPNELGFQFGIDEGLTEYAHQKQWQTANTFLPPIKITVLQVWKDDTCVSYLLIDEETNNPVKECFGYEAAACALDSFKFLEQSKEYDS